MPTTSRLQPCLLSGALSALVLVLAGCGTSSSSSEPDEPDEPGIVAVVAERWNGWDPADEPVPETTTLLGRVGESITLESVGEDVVIEVTDVRADEVEVTTGSPMAPEGETGGANLNDLEDTFVVPEGGEVVFTTPTLDAGVTFTLSLTAATGDAAPGTR